MTTPATGDTLGCEVVVSPLMVHEIHVRSSPTGLWSVEPQDRDFPRSEHTTETDAERTAIRRAAALEECSIVIHDRYARVRIVRVGGRKRR